MTIYSLQKRIYSYLNEWLPPIVLPHVLRFLVTLKFIFVPNKSLLKSNRSLKNIAIGRDAYVIATGPSLKALDLTFLEGRDCFSVSNFMLHDKIKKIAPKLHFFAPYHKPLILEDYVNWLRMADKILPPATGIVLGHKTKQLVIEHGLFENRVVYYLFLEKAQITKTPNLEFTVISPQSSPLMVLPVLHYMGYKRIFLIGCDHNILKNYGGVVENFYSPLKDPRRNATQGSNWEAGIIKHLEFALNVFKQYEFYANSFKGSGIQMFNVSPDSWLDFIEYMPINEITKI